jgi:DNA-directed RNA polymerase specialized sigma24 family protein
VEERARQDFAEFVAGRSAELLRLAYVLTADQHAAEDLLQSALAKAAARWGRIHSAPEGYVRQIMYREQVSWWRRRARRPVTVVARVPERPAQDQMVMVEARLALRDALLALPPGKRAPCWCCGTWRTCLRRRWPTSWGVLSAQCAAKRTRRSPS